MASGEGGGPDGQLLHLVFGGRLVSADSNRFADLSAVDIVGIFPDYRSALDAWRQRAQQTVDDALMRYYIVHLHRLLDPESAGGTLRPAP